MKAPDDSPDTLMLLLSTLSAGSVVAACAPRHASEASAASARRRGFFEFMGLSPWVGFGNIHPPQARVVRDRSMKTWRSGDAAPAPSNRSAAQYRLRPKRRTVAGLHREKPVAGRVAG